MRIAVTGANSDIARSLVAIAERRGHQVFLAPGSDVLDLLGPVAPWAAWLRETGPSVVIHLAGRKPPASDESIEATNVGGTRTLFDAMNRSTPGATIVLASSAAIYGATHFGGKIGVSSKARPINIYGVSKAEQERETIEFCERTGRMYRILRIFNVIAGKSDITSVAPALLRRIVDLADGQTLIVDNGTCIRDFVDVRDVAAAFIRVCEAAESAPIMNICSGKGTSIVALAELIARQLRKPIQCVSRDDASPALITSSVGDDAEARSAGWRAAISLEQSVRSLIDGYRA